MDVATSSWSWNPLLPEKFLSSQYLEKKTATKTTTTPPETSPSPPVKEGRKLEGYHCLIPISSFVRTI